MKSLFAFIFCLGAFPLHAIVPVPPLQGRVQDLTETLTAEEKTILEQKLADFEKTKGSQVVVLIVPSTEEEAIEQFSIRVAEAWKIGRKGVDDGVILLVAKSDKKLRIEVGYGLEGALPDAICKRIIDEQIVPRFRAGKFAEGITAGVDSILQRINGEPLPAPFVSNSQDLTGIPWTMQLIVTAFLSIFIIVGSLVPSAVNKFLCILPVAAGLAAAVAGYVVGGHWIVAVMFAAFATFFVGVFTTVMSGFFLSIFGLITGKKVGGWRISTSSGSSGWSSSSGSSFSGGGGSFGGGGASGSW